MRMVLTAATRGEGVKWPRTFGSPPSYKINEHWKIMQQNCLLLSGNTVVLTMLQDSQHHKIQVVFQSVTMHMSM